MQASTFQEYRVPGDGRATKKSSIFPVELVPALEETIKQCLPEHTMGILINNFWIDNQHLTKTAIETEFKKLARKAKSDADAPTKYMLRADIEQLKSRQSSREGGADVNYFESDEEDEVEFIKKIGGVEAIIVPVKDSVDVDVNGVGVTASVADDSIVDGIMDVHVAAAVNTDKVIALENEVVEITVDLGESACSHFKENQEIEKVHRSIEPKLEPEIIVSDQEMQVGSNFKDSAVISDEDVMEIPPPAISIEEVIIQPPTVAPLFSEIGGKISSNLDTDVVMDIGVINPSEAACKGTKLC